MNNRIIVAFVGTALLLGAGCDTSSADTKDYVDSILALERRQQAN
jgi:hypothetical protein